MKDIFANSIKLIVEKFVLGIPNLIMAIILAILGYIIAKSVAKLIKRILLALNVDRFGEMFNQIDVIRQNKIQVKVSSIFSGFIYYMLMLIFLVAATDVLQMEALSNLVSRTIEFIPNLVVAIAILIIGILAGDKLKNIVITTCDSLGIPSGKFIGNFVFYFVFITVFIMALSQASIDTDFLAQNISIIIAGVVLAFSIGYGLASKDLVANYLSAFTLKDKYSIGDQLIIGDDQGQIVGIDRTSVTIETADHRITYPISVLSKEKIKTFK